MNIRLGKGIGSDLLPSWQSFEHDVGVRLGLTQSQVKGVWHKTQ
jgi:hypothetical protein